MKAVPIQHQANQQILPVRIHVGHFLRSGRNRSIFQPIWRVPLSMHADYGLVPILGYGEVVDAICHLLNLALEVLRVGSVEGVLDADYVTSQPWYSQLPNLLAGGEDND